MSFSNIRLEQGEDGVAVLTLARPESLNALNAILLEECRAAIGEVAESPARCMLITGEGRGFSSGADLAGSGLPDDAGAALETHFNPLIEAIFELRIPVVAAVNGPAAGAGCSLALSADIVVAGKSAYFLQAFANIGLVPDAGATWLLPRLVGRARAMEMMLLGERVSAMQAREWGMIARVVEDEALEAEARALAARLAAGPTVALGLTRQLAHHSAELSLTEALGAERVAQRDAGRSEDFRTAVMAFLSKRKPEFRGR